MTKYQPLHDLAWINPKELHANDYNPNSVAKPELELLKISLLEDGWTQPIVAKPDGEIVDGFHRWTLAQEDPEVAALTEDGKVPVVRIEPKGDHEQMMSTIRHNRARGSHGVLPMAEIVRALKDEHGMDDEAVMRLLQMDFEEVDRLYDRAGMTERGSNEEYGEGWVPDANA